MYNSIKKQLAGSLVALMLLSFPMLSEAGFGAGSSRGVGGQARGGSFGQRTGQFVSKQRVGVRPQSRLSTVRRRTSSPLSFRSRIAMRGQLSAPHRLNFRHTSPSAWNRTRSHYAQSRLVTRGRYYGGTYSPRRNSWGHAYPYRYYSASTSYGYYRNRYNPYWQCRPIGQYGYSSGISDDMSSADDGSEYEDAAEQAQ